MAFILLVTLFVGYLDRVNISLALPLMAEEYGWTTEELTQRGELLFSLFYVGYGLANIFLSPLAARIGPRKSLLIIVVLWCFFTALGAFVSQILLALAACRLLLGVSEGVHFPMMNMLTRNWFPSTERGRANSIWISGLFLAVLLSPVILVPAMNAFGWRVGFWGLAILGLIITLPLIVRGVYDTPEDAPDMTSAEKDWIAAGQDQTAQDQAASGGIKTAAEKGRVRRLFTSPLFLILLLAGMLNNVIALGLTSWLPSFFVRTKGLAFEDLAWAVSLPFAGSIIGVWIWSNIGDRTSARALIAAIGYVLAGVLVYFSLSADAILMVMGFFAASIFLSSAYTAAEFALLQKALPASTLGSDVGLYNGLTTLVGGGLGPILVSSIVGDPDAAGSLERLLIVPAMCTVLAGVLLIIYARMRY
ncbi:MAG: MFS transporter [Pseudomonadota bacterium]